MLCSGREECDRGGGELPEGEVPRAGDATDLRLAMDERTVLQQMFDEKSGEVELLQQRLAGKSTFHSPFIETLSLQSLYRDALFTVPL